MKNKIISAFEDRIYAKRKKHPQFRSGDTVRVHYRIQEGEVKGKKKFRVQPFEGVVIRNTKGTADSSFTVRRIGANGVGVERVFPHFSPNIDKIDLIASGIVRRSRLYYLRELSGKAARIRSRYIGKKKLEGLKFEEPVEEPVASPEPEVKKEVKAEAKAPKKEEKK